MSKSLKIVGGLVVSGGLMIGAGIWAYQQTELIEGYDEKFYPGTVINGYSVEGKTVDEVLTQLNEQLEEQAHLQLTIKNDQFEESKSLKELGLHYKEELKQVSRLSESQQTKSWLEKLKAIKQPTIQSLEFDLGLDDSKLNAWVADVEKTLYQEPVNATVSLKGTVSSLKPIVNEGMEGIQLNKRDLYLQMKQLPALPWSRNQVVKATLTAIEYDIKEEVLEEIQSPIGSWTSLFNPEESRAKNVKRAATLIHNTLVMPGETFSYNKHVLPATEANGYGYGIIFVNGEKVPGLAGGICQVSSTLYNAVLEAGIKADSRQNHSLFVDYVPYGQDATMNDAGLDFTFTNPYDVPLLVQATTEGGRLTVSLWSNSSVLKGLNYKAYTKKISEKKYDTYLQAYNSAGVLVSSEFLHRSTYK